MKEIHIATYGKMGSGKDFVAEYIIKKYGYSRYAFADNVKAVAEMWFPDLYGDGKRSLDGYYKLLFPISLRNLEESIKAHRPALQQTQNVVKVVNKGIERQNTRTYTPRVRTDLIGKFDGL